MLHLVVQASGKTLKQTRYKISHSLSTYLMYLWQPLLTVSVIVEPIGRVSWMIDPCTYHLTNFPNNRPMFAFPELQVITPLHSGLASPPSAGKDQKAAHTNKRKRRGLLCFRVTIIGDFFFFFFSSGHLSWIFSYVILFVSIRMVCGNEWVIVMTFLHMISCWFCMDDTQGHSSTRKTQEMSRARLCRASVLLMTWCFISLFLTWWN